MAVGYAAIHGNYKLYRVKVLAAVREGWQLVWVQRKAWFLWYLGNFLLALIAVLPLRSFLKSGAGRSTELIQAAGQFDFTLFADLLRNESDGLPALITLVLTMVFAYVLLSAFLSGGVLQLYTSPGSRYTSGAVVQGGAKYFWRMLGLALCFVICFIILIFIAFLITTGGGFQPMMIENDVVFVRKAKIVIGICMCIAIVFMMIHTFAKIILVETSSGIFSAIQKSIAYIFGYFGKIALLYLINALILLIVIVSYRCIRDVIPTGSAFGILTLFLIGQIFLCARIGVKLLVMASGCRLRNQTYIP